MDIANEKVNRLIHAKKAAETQHNSNLNNVKAELTRCRNNLQETKNPTYGSPPTPYAQKDGLDKTLCRQLGHHHLRSPPRLIGLTPKNQIFFLR